jgi:hypothetical protein
MMTWRSPSKRAGESRMKASKQNPFLKMERSLHKMATSKKSTLVLQKKTLAKSVQHKSVLNTKVVLGLQGARQTQMISSTKTTWASTMPRKARMMTPAKRTKPLSKAGPLPQKMTPIRAQKRGQKTPSLTRNLTQDSGMSATEGDVFARPPLMVKRTPFAANRAKQAHLVLSMSIDSQPQVHTACTMSLKTASSILAAIRIVYARPPGMEKEESTVALSA